MRKLLKKLFQFPGPQHKALTMDFFAQGDELTWEKYHAEMKIKYPARFWVTQSLPLWFRVHVSMPIEEFRYWVVSNVIPSRRFHMLDLREPKSKDKAWGAYRYGWIDSDSQIFYAVKNILFNFVEKEQKTEERIGWLKKELAEASEDDKAFFHGSLEKTEEVYSLYLWFKNEQPAQEIEETRLCSVWHDGNKVKPKAETEADWKTLNEYKEMRERELTEHLMKVIELRGYLWT